MCINANFQPNISSQISHELRTPLIGIMGMVHFLRQTPLDSKQREYLNALLKSAQQLEKVEEKINNLLLLSLEE